MESLPLVILHEIAHAVSDWNNDKHGPIFCGHFLYLVYHRLGVCAYQELRKRFLLNGVDFNDPIQAAIPVLTTEQIIEKMKAMPKRKANPAAIDALRRYRETKKMAHVIA